MVSGRLTTSELRRHRNHGTQTCEREGKTSVLLGQVGLIADSPDERADVEHMQAYPREALSSTTLFADSVRAPGTQTIAEPAKQFAFTHRDPG